MLQLLGSKPVIIDHLVYKILKIIINVLLRGIPFTQIQPKCCFHTSPRNLSSLDNQNLYTFTVVNPDTI